jgi:cobalt/nickel transport system permease protein
LDCAQAARKILSKIKLLDFIRREYMQPVLHFLKPVFLHVPDGLLSLPVAILCWIISALLVLVAVRRSKGELGERQVPLMGIMAAFIFAAQMINFPVAGGTSGHLLGGALAAITLGPWGAMLVMTSVIMVQALLFQDGGLVVMGANILNMGLLTVLLSYGLYRATAGRSRGVRLGVAGLAAWLSVMAAALATALQLWLSGTARLDIVVPAMLFVHALIGIGEALITVAALAFILRTRPDLVEAHAAPGARGGKGWIVVGLLLSLAVVALAPLASADPDGLERVAHNLGFLDLAGKRPTTFLPDYTVPFLGETALSTILAGALGALGVAALVVLVMRYSPVKSGFTNGV